MKLCDQNKCTGCQACRVICPKRAITMTETNEGKIVPVIDENKCVNCGLCEKTCPVLTEPGFKLPIKTFAAWTLNVDDKKACASGGIATGLYRYVLDKDGVIYGCDYDENLKPVIRRSETEDDLDKFRRSKYVQSSTEDSYLDVRKDLQEGRLVIYVGSPCQIDGLIHFLGKQYENLYTVDIICHGVPPFKYLQEYADKVSGGRKISKVGFRGEHNFCLTLYDGEELVYNEGSWDDFYFTTFLEGVTYRDNCYQCRYARKERISDLTIGDFWGLDKSTLKEKYNGRVSVILANTKRGIEFLEKISSLHCEERTLEEAIKENDQLNHPMPIPEDRKRFLANLDKGVYSALKSTKMCKRILFKKAIKGSAFYKIYKSVKK